MIISKITKITGTLLFLICAVIISSSTVFAQSDYSDVDAIKHKDASAGEVSITASSTPITSHGGHGEYGWGWFNAWAKYAHDDYTHRVVLQTDNTYTFGAWELAGGNNYSYVENAKGKKTNYAYGEIR